MTSYDPTQDEQLTAYALGELEPGEALAVEQTLAEHPEARAFVDDVRRTGRLLSRELHGEAVPSGRLGQIEDPPLALNPPWRGRRLGVPQTKEGEGAKAGAGKALAIATHRPNWLVRATAKTLALAAVIALAAVVWMSVNPVERALKSSERGAVATNLPRERESRSADPSALVLNPQSVRAQSEKLSDKDVAEHLKEAKSYALSAAASPPPSAAALPTELPNPAFARTPQQRPQEVRMKFLSPATPPSSGARSERIVGQLGSPVYEIQVAPADTTPRLNHRYFRYDGGRELDRRGDLAPPNARLGNGLTPAQRNNPNFNTEAYDSVTDNPFRRVVDEPLSTFGIDVDTASYSNVRRFLTMGQLPPRGAVRIEELVNYFPYYYAPEGEAAGNPDQPFIAALEVASCPWTPEHRLVRIGLQARKVDNAQRPPSNLVFLIDVSGSMNEPNKLPLVKESLRMLTKELGENDRVAMVVYAGSTGLVLDSTPCHRRHEVFEAIDHLEAGGSTNGGAGIELAYKIAAANLIKNGTNRVILATDGDFNVGITDRSSLVKLIEDKRGTGVFLSVLGFGMGNLKDSQMEELADKGNGNYAYIDSLREARKVLVEQMGGTLVTVAKDVKVQVEFNPGMVESYRLIGYENRILAKEDFNDDRKDAGDIGAGHTVTALYEVVPAGKPADATSPKVDELKYQRPSVDLGRPIALAPSKELLTVKLRYKEPEGDVSTKVEYPLTDTGVALAKASRDFKFAAAVAGLGMILRDSPHRGGATFDSVLELAQEGVGEDRGGYRTEFLDLVRKARELRDR